jgi:iron(III) transport system substrate-binding protein
MKKAWLFSLGCIISLCMSVAHAVEEKREVTLYSAQAEHLIRPVLDGFTKETGIAVNLITGDAAALVIRLQQEGKNTPADALLTADIGNLTHAKTRHLLQAVESDILTRNIPAHLRDSDKQWFGFTRRVRLLFVRKDMPEAEHPKEYMDIIQPAYSKGILVRSSEHVYNQSLLASILYHQGEEAALRFAQGIAANLARAPQGGDRDQLRALAAGEGKVAIANSYYYAMLLGDDPALKDGLVKEHVVAVIPNQSTTGAHTNIRGGGVTAHAKHEKEAIALLEYMSGKEAQALFATLNNEYPVNPEVTSDAAEKLFGKVKFDETPLEKIGALQTQAILIMDKAGWK